MNFSIAEIITCFAVLFAVIDIPGNIPIVVDLKRKAGHIQAEKATLVAGLLLILFLYFGQSILRVLGVDVQSFAVAGAFVLFIIAVEMILGIEIQKEIEAKSVSIVPLAFPLIAGAGSLTTTLSLKSKFSDINIIIAILLNMVVVYFALKFSGKLERILGPGILAIIKKVFGIVLLAIAVKLFVTNISALVQSIQP